VLLQGLGVAEPARVTEEELSVPLEGLGPGIPEEGLGATLEGPGVTELGLEVTQEGLGVPLAGLGDAEPGVGVA
jgi:hypothetical protein